MCRTIRAGEAGDVLFQHRELYNTIHVISGAVSLLLLVDVARHFRDNNVPFDAVLLEISLCCLPAILLCQSNVCSFIDLTVLLICFY